MFKNRGLKGLFSHRQAKDALLLAAASLLLSSPAHDSYGGVKALQQQPRVASEEAARARQASAVTVPDEQVLNQDGKPVNFYNDLVKGKIVVVHFVFTTCEDVCPMQGESLSKLQARLAEMGKEVHFISVSLDPETDTPERLKAWGKMFGAGPNWTLVTGRKQQIDKIIKAFTGGETGKGEHSALFVIGNASTGVWRRAYGLGETSRLLRLIDQVAASAP